MTSSHLQAARNEGAESRNGALVSHMVEASPQERTMRNPVVSRVAVDASSCSLRVVLADAHRGGMQTVVLDLTSREVRMQGRWGWE